MHDAMYEEEMKAQFRGQRPEHLGEQLRAHLSPADYEGHAILDALLLKAEQRDEACAVCYQAAVHEGERRVLQEKG